jgi:hypothetical protein
MAVARAGEVHALALEQDLPAGRLVHARHRLDEGRLARAVVAQQAMALARPDVEADPVQRDDRAEMLLDVLHLDDGL